MNERDELVARLQNETRYVELSRAAADAADQIKRDGREIERLTAENQRLRKALRECEEALNLHGEMSPHMVKGYTLSALKGARAALNGEGET